MTTKPDFDKGWTEPESQATVDNPPKYPYNNITQTESGHSFEMDDTPGRERIRLQHRSGTFTETHSDGTEVHKIIGDGFEIVSKDKNVLIKGVCNITVNGDAIFHVKGNKYERIDGDFEQEILGNYIQTVKKESKILSEGDMTIGSNSDLNGSLYISTGDHVYIDSDLNVAGEIVADKIASRTRVDAGTGISAGALGFVSMTGGLSLGIPAAVPLSIYTIGSINSTTSVNAPFGNFGIMTAVLMTDTINSRIYNTHIHKAPKGWTTPPRLKMV